MADQQQEAIGYLRAFGYLRDLPKDSRAFLAPAEDENTLKAAILCFQDMAQLPLTGELDEATVAKMKMPRCGVPDVGHGPTLMAGEIERFELFGTVWRQGIVTYRIENFSPDMNQARQRELIQIAFARWAGVIPLVFREINGGTADIRIGFAAGDHGDGHPFDGPGQTLAHAFFPPPNAGDLSGDLHYDEDEAWQDGMAAPRFDLLTVTVHELGHALGLKHTSVLNSTMNPFYPTPATPQADDRNGVRTAYAEHIWIASLYRDLLRRRFDDAGFDNWVRARSSGMTPGAVARGFCYSEENSGIIATELYRWLLDRAPDSGGLANWTNALRNGMSRQAAILGFLTSAEYLGKHPLPDQFVDSLYRKLLKRPPDPGGFQNWVNFLKGGGTPAQAGDGFLRSEEFVRSFVRSLYRDYLRRDPDQGGWDNWKAAVQAGMAHQDAVAGFLSSDEYRGATVGWW